MLHYLRLIVLFFRSSFQQDIAYRSNFVINFLYSVINLVVAVVGLDIIFGQVESVQGWTYTETLALLGVYLMITSLRTICLGPSLESIAGMDGELWTGKFDFTLLRPVDVQFLTSFRAWRPFALLDLLLGSGVILRAITLAGDIISIGQVGLFALALLASILMTYSLLLGFSGLTFWNPGLLFTWIFDGIFQLARFPVGIYPPWVRIFLTWIIPIGFITTVPAEILSGKQATVMVWVSLGIAIGMFLAASLLFRLGVRRYASASS